MWLDRAVYDKMVKDEATQRGRADALVAYIQGLNATMDWMRIRLTQVEHERSQMFFNMTGVKVVAPEYAAAKTLDANLQDLLHSAMSFDDVGDAEAHRLGVSHADDGTLAFKA